MERAQRARIGFNPIPSDLMQAVHIKSLSLRGGASRSKRAASGAFLSPGSPGAQQDRPQPCKLVSLRQLHAAINHERREESHDKRDERGRKLSAYERRHGRADHDDHQASGSQRCETDPNSGTVSFIPPANKNRRARRAEIDRL